MNSTESGSGPTPPLEEQIDQWRSRLSRVPASHAADVARLEEHLRREIKVLLAAGLADDEAFLVAVKRTGRLDPVAGAIDREEPDRLRGAPRAGVPRDGLVAFGLAVAAALLVKVPAMFGVRLDVDAEFYARNASLFVLPLLAGYFAWKRGLGPRRIAWLALAFAGAGIVVNVYPFTPRGHTEALAALHLPIALWLIVGTSHAAERWRQVGGRMDFVRFSGEIFIQYVLIALGGGVLAGFMAMTFEAIGIDPGPFLQFWLLPCGAAGAVLVGSWLVEARQGVIGNMAPVLTRLFTPLFAALLVTFLGAVLWTGRGIDIDRNVLIVFDLLLVVILGLVLYSVSARDPRSAPGLFDVLQIVLLVSALLADAVALWAIAARLSGFGFTPNRVAALGENVILLFNLAWSAVLYIRFLAGRGSFTDLERWQTNYIPVYAAWAALVVLLFPPLFGYI